ncbi:MAG TPA: PTS sugar transporter subunit IIC [Deltaproteobacteria bacterium]|jgi:mannose/fructose/N-acetylgalactosamine-specific phosphotransferase system component IIC|nr:MAG: PTS system sorbose-specific iic component [Deltaproteobacteria bacterium ADurb.Bin072]HNQ85411.1 PTS sugar transporter subunit IIC [Deltaproteobacteria bacterium]HRW80444.1 PTS sugar transporter subunit IIC [Desulfomonilia bacterium]HOA44712.1 PTS sugar transporter subunit IIC [Deltaproteobacteria bacterium]HOC75878.1 PTS sugar transporter subunit IIC [Deltaproteobacteria bacterium]
MMTACFFGVLAGAVLWMDRVFVFQFMVSRPMIMGPLIGLVMGDMRTGILVGVSLELLWLNSPPVGAYLPNDESFCTAVAVPVAVMTASWASPAAAAGLSVLLSLPCSLAGRALDMRLRTMNEGVIAHQANTGEREVSQALIKAVSRAFVMALVLLGFCTFVLGWVSSLVRTIIPDNLITALSIVPFACVMIGLASLVSREMPRKSHAGMFALGLVLVLVLTWML